MKEGIALIEHSNLEEYLDPVNYDLEFDGEMDKYQFYLELARSSPGEVLELACGTGLTTIPLSKAGITMTGGDISSAMLAYARLKAEGLTVTFMEGDARTFESDKRFSMIYLTGNAFQAFLSDQDQIDRFAHDRSQTFPMESLHWKPVTGGNGFIRSRGAEWGSGTQCYDTSQHIMHWVTIHCILY